MICNRCTTVFDEPKRRFSFNGQIGVGYPTLYSVCPNCESMDIEDSKNCPLCGEQMAWSKDYCTNCEKTIVEAKEMVVNIFKKETGLGYKESINVLVEFLEKEL